ncbi:MULTISPECIES: autotransporter outer membrane beta-barrel domain-containing protein [unclassified Rhizobium]|uniref:autotransporter outer membrane beta-barrel domain-containing protein n=1 Tax=unclassified Rhizobium TaxID=2613769 RepID=UPI001FD85593|nr:MULTISPECIES: autotransporter domain-containing protein [unclassified Rhizobium]
MPTHGFAQSTWAGGNPDNDFSNSSNWTPAAPDANDTARVDAGSPQVSNDVTVGHLDVDGGNVTISNTGVLTSTNGTTITSGSVSINSGGVVNSNVSLDGGSLSLDGQLNGQLNLNNGNVSVNGTLGSAIVGTGTALTNNGTTGQVNVSTGATLVNNSGAIIDEITNAGTASNAGTVGDVTNTAGSFTNDGTVTGKTTVSGGTVTNNFVITDADVAAAATFVNNSGATAGAVTNAGTGSNAGTVASLTNTAGSFTNNAGGTITGKTIVEGGTVTNNFVITDADVAAAASFVNNTGATADAVRNAGTATNAGTIASLQNDGGTFTNNAGGTVTGGTNISGGSVTNNASLNNVNVGTAGTFANTSGATAGTVTNAGTASNAGTIASLTNTAGSFTNNAGGTVVGTTTVAGGTVTNNFVITDADVAAAAAFVNNTGATAGDVRNAGTVTNAGTIASVQNDGGTFTNNAGGAVTGLITVAGGNVVNNATLANVDVGAAGTFINNSGATAGAVTNSGIAANDGTIAALQNNAGTFSNTGAISGAATVSGGSLVNDGSISGIVDIDEGGLLSGAGTVGGILVNAGGILTPGPGIATLGVSGDVTFATGSTYQVDIAASGLSDRVDATGTISIQGGTLAVKAAAGNYAAATSYTILNGSSITGTFDTVTSDFAFLSPTLIYDATTIDMRLDRNGVQFADVADTANGRATAAAVEALGSGRAVYDAVLSLDSATAASAFSQLSGEAHASLKSALLWQSRLPREAILDEIAWGPHQRDTDATFWTSGFLSSNVLSGGDNAAGIDARFNGALFGADAPVSDHWRVGGVVGYGQQSFDKVSTDSYYAGLYAMGDLGPMQFAGGAIYAHNEASTRRDIAFGTFADQLSANYASATSQILADLSWTYEWDALKVQPFANLAYINLDTDAFQEQGGDAALSVTGGNAAITSSTVGLRWAMDWPESELPLSVSGLLGWRHIGGDVTPYSRMTFSGSSPFIIAGTEMPRDSVVAEIGVAAKLSKSSRLTLSYSGAFGKGLRSNAIQMNLVTSF